MDLLKANALFVADEEGVMVITDIQNKPDVTYGEFLYDGKNTAFLNRNNEEFFVLQNIPPYLRENITYCPEIVIIEHRDEEDIYAYSIKVKLVGDLNLPDDWKNFAQDALSDLKKMFSAEELEDLCRT